MIGALRMLARWLARRHGPLGPRSERVAEFCLRARGLQLVGRNVRVGRDEIDLLMLDPGGSTIILVEVKARRGEDVLPEERIDRSKQAKLARAAAKLLQKPQFAGRAVRFDAVAVTWPERGRPVVKHYPAAFDSPW